MSALQSSTVWLYAKWPYGEKEKSRESKAKDTMTRTLGSKDGLPDE